MGRGREEAERGGRSGEKEESIIQVVFLESIPVPHFNVKETEVRVPSERLIVLRVTRLQQIK